MSTANIETEYDDDLEMDSPADDDDSPTSLAPKSPLHYTPNRQKENISMKLHRSVVVTTSFSPAIAPTPNSRTPRHRTPMSVYKSALSTPYSDAEDNEQYVSDFEISATAKTPVRNIVCVSYTDMDSSTPLSRSTAAAELISRSNKKRAIGTLHLSAIKNNLKQTPKMVVGPTTPRVMAQTTPTSSRKSMLPIRSDLPSSSSRSPLPSPNRASKLRKSLFSGRKGAAPPSSLAIVQPKLLGEYF